MIGPSLASNAGCPQSDQANVDKERNYRVAHLHDERDHLDEKDKQVDNGDCDVEVGQSSAKVSMSSLTSLVILV